MELRFITATYTDGVYRIADYFVGANFVAGTAVNYNFTADDGLSSLIVNNTDMTYRTMTHMIVPDLNKVYEISGYEYVNDNQTRLILTEDPLIANWLALNTGTGTYITRTNDVASFLGVHDIETAGIEYTTTLASGMTAKTGKWMLLTFRDTISVDLSFARIPATDYATKFEAFPNLAAVIAKYPEVATTHPQSIYYMDKVVYDGTILRQCYYDGASVRWVAFTEMGAGPGPKNFTLSASYNKIIMGEGDISTLSVLIPFSSRNEARFGPVNYYPIPSIYNLVSAYETGGTTPATLISARVIDENLIAGFNPAHVTSRWQILSACWITYQDTIDTDTVLTYPKVFEEDIQLNVSAGTITDVYDYEPFTEYTLSIYGNRFKINRKLITSSLRFRYQILSTNISILVYFGHVGNTIWQGQLNTTGLMAVDKFDEFLLQNSTYNQVKFANNMGNFISRTVIGGVGGALATPGNPIGVAVGVVSGLVSSAVQLANQRLQEKAMRDAPDTIRGENNDLSTILNSLFGIFLIKRVPATAELNVMKNNYLFKGHPTYIRSSINSLVATAHPILPGINFKLVYGETKTVIGNSFITNIINDRLRNGIIFVV